MVYDSSIHHIIPGQDGHGYPPLHSVNHDSLSAPLLTVDHPSSLVSVDHSTGLHATHANWSLSLDTNSSNHNQVCLDVNTNGHHHGGCFGTNDNNTHHFQLGNDHASHVNQVKTVTILDNQGNPKEVGFGANVPDNLLNRIQDNVALHGGNHPPIVSLDNAHSQTVSLNNGHAQTVSLSNTGPTVSHGPLVSHGPTSSTGPFDGSQPPAHPAAKLALASPNNFNIGGSGNSNGYNINGNFNPNNNVSIGAHAGGSWNAPPSNYGGSIGVHNDTGSIGIGFNHGPNGNSGSVNVGLNLG